MNRIIKSLKKPQLLLAFSLLLAGKAAAQPTNFYHDFETGMAPFAVAASPSTALTISTFTNKIPSNGSNSAKMVISTDKVYANLTPPVTAESFKYTFYYYDNNGTATRVFGEVRAYAAGSYNGSTGLLQLWAAGRDSGSSTPRMGGEAFNSSKYQGRIVNGAPNSGYFNLDLPGSPNRSVGWHRFDIERGLRDDGSILSMFYVDGKLSRVVTNSSTVKWDSVTIGSVSAGTTAGDAYFDGVQVVEGQAFISTQPVGLTNDVGMDFTLTVAAIGDAGPLSYQWRKNGVNIAGATDPSYTVTNPQTTNSGNFTVVVTNILDVKTSEVAVVVINPIFRINTQPTSQLVNLGSSATFTVDASGNGTLTYQWRKNGTNIVGATDASYTIDPVQATDAGTYSVVIQNGIDPNITSSNAVLSVNLPPIIAAIPNQTGTVSNIFSLTVPTTDDRSSIATPFADFENFTNGNHVMFCNPNISGTTLANVDTNLASFSVVTNGFPAGHAGSKVVQAHWNFIGPWLRLTTTSNGVSALGNPIISFTQRLRFDVYCDQSIGIALGARENNATGAIGADAGGSTASVPIEFVGVTAAGSPPAVTRVITPGSWTTLDFDMPNEPAGSFNVGNGVLNSTTGKGTLEMLGLTAAAGNGTYNLYVDNFVVVPTNHVEFALDLAPEGATIDPITGVITFMPTNTGSYSFTVRATDNGTLFDIKSFNLQVEIATPDPGAITISNLGNGQVTLNWEGSFTLQSATAVEGPYTDVAGPVLTGPHTVTASGSAKFYRLKK